MRRTFATALTFAFWICAAQAGPQVLTTIKPVHALVAGVMQGAGMPDLIIRGAQSEHSYALKPSDALRIAHADIVFEIGPGLETYLERPLATLSHGKVIALIKAPGMRLLPARHGGLWETGGDGDGPSDPHIWLDPENAVAMTRAIADTLAKADPGQAPLYRANAARQVAGLAALERKLAARLAPLRGRPYLVFHDGYRYFESRFGLDAVGAVTVAPDRPVGPRRIAMLRERIAKGDIACVFREPQFAPRLIDTLTEGSPVHRGVLDPIGAGLEPGPDLYAKLLDGLAGSLDTCLAKRP